MRYVEVAIRALLAVVFVAAFLGKAWGRASYPAFVRSLRQMNVVPEAILRPVAALTVTAEAAVVPLLLVPSRWTGTAGFALAGVLLATFTAVVARTVHGERRTPCRCFGASEEPLGGRHVIRNAALTLAAGLGLATSAAPGELQWAAASLAILAGMLAGALVAAFDDLVALYRPLA